MLGVTDTPTSQSDCKDGQQVDVLLSTYNGEKHLREQLNSVLSQTYQNLNVIVRDDGSSDATILVLKEEQSKDSRIQIINDDLGNLGPARSFMTLLRYSISPFVMFCDQDDVWRNNKIELSIAAICGKSQTAPCLVQSDLEVVSENLSLISDSYISRHNLPSHNTFADLLVQNNVTGCTVLFNAQLREVALQYRPSYMVMHDGWLALLASLYGHVVMIDEPLIKYRQHGGNAVGSRRLAEKIFDRIKSPKKMLALYAGSELQARELDNLRRISNYTPHKKEAAELADYLSYCNGGLLKRLSFFFHSKYQKQPFLTNLLYRLMFVLLTFSRINKAK
jgi:glycosyltransferase involved in cell wall biosynthesis